jgi:arsenate reductase-like glutaredoxin family protein
VGAREALQRKGFALELHDIQKDAPSKEFLEKHMDESRLKDFLSTRSPRFKELGWDRRLPSKKEAIARMLEEPNLIRRPVIVDGAKVYFGFDKKSW